MKEKLFYLIKISSSLLITGALGIEIWNFYLHLTNEILPNQLYPVLEIASLALIAHCVEGLIAGVQANSCNKNFLTYGIYTFFVGFVGLLELQEISSNAELGLTNIDTIDT